MKKSHLFFAAAVAGLSSSAFAGANTNHQWSEPALTTGKTRMQVRSEVEQAYQEGTLVRGADYNYPAASPGGTSRTINSAPQAQWPSAPLSAEDVFKYGA